MAAYMKTDMPFHGVQKPRRERILKAVVRDRPPTSRRDLHQAIKALWALPHREEKYIAIRLAGFRDDWITSASVPLYERMIREGAWWDFVDDLASAAPRTRTGGTSRRG